MKTPRAAGPSEPRARQVVQRGAVGGLGGAVALSSDGFAVTVSDDKLLRIWHVPSRMLVRVISEVDINDGYIGHPLLPVWDVSTHEVLLPQSHDVIAIGLDGQVTTRPWKDPYNLVRIPGRGRWLAWGGQTAVLDDKGAVIARISPGARLEAVAVAGDGRVAVGLAKAGLVRMALDPPENAGVMIPLPGASSFDGRVAVARDGDAALVCFRGPGGKLLRVSHLSTTPAVSPLVFPGGGTGCLAAFTGPDFAVVDTGSELVGLVVSSGRVTWRTPLPQTIVALAASDDGRQVITMDFDGHVTIFDGQGGVAIADLGARVATPEHVAFLSNGDLAVVGSRSGPPLSRSDRVAVWSMRDGTRTQSTIIDWGDSFVVDAKGIVHAGRTDGVKGVPPCAASERGAWFASFPSQGTGAGSSGPRASATRAWPPGPMQPSVVCADDKGSIVASDPIEGRVVTMTRANPPVFDLYGARGERATLKDVPPGSGMCGARVSFSRDGKRIFAAPCTIGMLSDLHLWDAATGAKLGNVTADPADGPAAIVIGAGPQKRAGYYTEAVSDDGGVLAVGSEGAVTLYELPGLKPIHTLRVMDGVGTVTAVAFAANARDRVLVGTSTGVLLASAADHTFVRGESSGGGIRTLRVRADGQRVATASDDGAARVWDARARLLASFVDFSDGEYLGMTPRGAYVGTAEAAERIGWVFDEPTEGFEFKQFARGFNRPEIVAKRMSQGAAEDVPDALVRPPRVTFKTKPPERSTTATVKLEVHVASHRTVSSLHVFVEGRPVRVIPIGTEEADVSFDVPLLPGNDAITLVAFDDGGRSSNPVGVEVVAPVAGRMRPDIWVVAAGVGSYPKLPADKQLEAATNDARGIASAFAGQAGPGLTYERAHTTLLMDDQVTPATVDAALRGLSAMRPDDLAIVFFAGHGVKLADGNMVFLTGGASAREAEAIAAGIGWSKIGASLAAARGRVLVLLDSCHSGHVSQDLVVPNSALANALMKDHRAGVFVFAASKGRQESLEASTSRSLVLEDSKRELVAAPVAAGTPEGHGYFTGAFLQALRAQSTDVNGDGVIALSELVSQVTLRVTRASEGRQTPWVVRRELFGDFGIGRATTSGN